MRNLMGMLALFGLVGMLFASSDAGDDSAGWLGRMGADSGASGNETSVEAEAADADDAAEAETETEVEAGTNETEETEAEDGNEASGEDETDELEEQETGDAEENETEDAGDDAEERAAAVRQLILEKRYAQLGCRAAFLYSMMASAEEHGNVSLADERAAVEAVMGQLGATVASGEFVSYSQSMDEIRNAFAVAVREAKGAQMDALRAAEDEAEGEDETGAGDGEQARERERSRTALRDEMKGQYRAAHEAFVSCMHEAVRERIEAELEEFSGWHARGREIADSMEARNYSVSDMRETLDEADDAAEELGAAVDANLSTEELSQLRKEKWGREFYLWAQFHRERINLLLDRFEEKTDGYEEEVAAIRAALDEAAGIGDDEIYTLEEARQSKALVTRAMADFSALVEEARG
ncbi:MAG: hypothetical protein AB1657_03410 [Candidatus Micrarchaeota archaeon]